MNGPFGDPGLLVSLRWRGRALLFDLGRIDRIPAAELLRVRYVFVSHTHMDHFIGFDHLLRLFLARQSRIDLFGPPGVVENVLGKLRGYTWNLVEGYPFVLVVHEVGRQEIRSAVLPATAAFAPEWLPPQPFRGVILQTDGFAVRTVHLDHRIDSLGYALQEERHLNVRTDELDRLAIPAGRWLNELKAAIRAGAGDDTEIVAEWRSDGEPQRRSLRLGALRRQLLVEAPGQKLVYVTDTLFSAANAERVVELARDADVFFCESLMLDVDRDQALKRYHLTARQAGTLARRAGVKRLEVFHFSPRYDGEAERLRNEAQATFRGEVDADEPV